MYCINCGVELADSERQCPLCRTPVYHPSLKPPAEPPLYPKGKLPPENKTPPAFAIFMTVLWALGILIVLLCDLQINRRITWSGYPVGAMITAYVWLALPSWFRSPNPVIFVPCAFAAALGYLLYIDLSTSGSWFLSFALPVTGGLAVITTTLTVLLRYVKKGRLYTIGGTMIALGGFMPVTELLLSITFRNGVFYGWSGYPLVALVLLGGWLIFLAICAPVREALERRFFF